MEIKLLLPLFIASSLLSAGASASADFSLKCSEVKKTSQLAHGCSLFFDATSPKHKLAVNCMGCNSPGWGEKIMVSKQEVEERYANYCTEQESAPGCPRSDYAYLFKYVIYGDVDYVIISDSNESCSELSDAPDLLACDI